MTLYYRIFRVQYISLNIQFQMAFATLFQRTLNMRYSFFFVFSFHLNQTRNGCHYGHSIKYVFIMYVKRWRWSQSVCAEVAKLWKPSLSFNHHHYFITLCILNSHELQNEQKHLTVLLFCCQAADNNCLRSFWKS